eukprot:COSAG01_NODE_747_length_13858_cov_8.394869_7_plen_117_part_00
MGQQPGFQAADVEASAGGGGADVATGAGWPRRDWGRWRRPLGAHGVLRHTVAPGEARGTYEHCLQYIITKEVQAWLSYFAAMKGWEQSRTAVPVDAAQPGATLNTPLHLDVAVVAV